MLGYVLPEDRVNHFRRQLMEYMTEKKTGREENNDHLIFPKLREVYSMTREKSKLRMGVNSQKS